MMNIPYKYEIVAVDTDAKSMEVRFTSPGLKDYLVGMRLPWKDEDAESHIRAYAPVFFWMEECRDVQVPATGQQGSLEFSLDPGAEPTFDVSTMTVEEAQQIKLRELAFHRYEKESAGIDVNGVAVRTDRESLEAMDRALNILKSGVAASIDWKIANDSWISVGLEDLTIIYQLVMSYVQDCFTKEKSLAEQIAGLSTVEDVVGFDIITKWSA